MKCPRRNHVPSMYNPREEDEWGERHGDRHCSYCGSLHPDDVIAAIENGGQVTPTDKNYKIYIEAKSSTKAYFQHFEERHIAKLLELVNSQKVNFAYPGGFYVLPYFFTEVNP